MPVPLSPSACPNGHSEREGAAPSYDGIADTCPSFPTLSCQDQTVPSLLTTPSKMVKALEYRFAEAESELWRGAV